MICTTEKATEALAYWRISRLARDGRANPEARWLAMRDLTAIAEGAWAGNALLTSQAERDLVRHTGRKCPVVQIRR